MPNLGASKTVVNTTTAPSTPPINFHQGCDGIVDKLPHKSVLANAIKKRKIVPTAKEIKRGNHRFATHGFRQLRING